MKLRAISACLFLLHSLTTPVSAGAQAPGPESKDPSKVVSASDFHPATEEEYLRHVLKLPPGMRVRVSDTPFPDRDPIRILFVIYDNPPLIADLGNRVIEWNAKDAKKYGAIEVATELGKADVVLVLMRGIKAKLAPSPDVPGLKGTPDVGPDISPFEKEGYAPFYRYVAIRTDEELTIVRREAAWSPLFFKPRKVGSTWDEIAKRLKQRAKPKSPRE